MNRICSYLVVVSAVVALCGCSEKKDNPVKAPVKPGAQGTSQAPAPPGGAAPTQPAALVPANPRDEADATPVRDRVLAHVKKAEFASIYREASPGFREVGPEEKFLELWNRQLQDTGPLKSVKEISHGARPQDQFQVFVYQVHYEKAEKQLKLTFGRSKKGSFELTGINQTEVKK